MEDNFPFHHPSLFEQGLSFSNTTAATRCSSDEFHQLLEQPMPNNSSIEDNIVAVESCKIRRGKQKKIIDQETSNKILRDDYNSQGDDGGYIYVRARRGEATDSHSLAERVRRERISEKMKTLQAIVPGCDKITGKALMLEEVINYVHSLQNQIQILSSKLASVNPMFGVASDASMLTPDQNTTTYLQEHLMLLQEDQMPCTISQNNEEIMWDIGEQKQELDDLFAIINNFNAYG